MDLKQYLDGHSDIALYDSTHDNEQVLNFMARAPMRVGGVELLYDRSPQFERLLTCQAPLHATFLGKTLENKIMGFFSVSVTDKWIHGLKTSCAYIGDFRTDNSRKSAVTWRRAYAELLKVLSVDESLGKPVYFLTAILKKNAAALKNLTAAKKELGFRYDFLQEFDMVNVYGVLPWAGSGRYRVQHAEARDLDALKIFLNTHEKKKLFGSVFDETLQDCWNHRSKTWPQFKLENFLLIKDVQGRIQACTLPWDPGFAKRMSVLRAPRHLRLLFKFLSILGFNTPSVGESLRTLYLSHLSISDKLNSAEAVFSFLRVGFKENPNIHLIAFADTKETSQSLKSCITQRVPVTLYSVRLKDTAPLEPTKEVGFEMCLV